MRSIVGQRPPEIELLAGSLSIARADALEVTTFRELMQHVARLAYANKDHLLFFRGQRTDHRNKAQASTFYPTIYRGERLTQAELSVRFDLLHVSARRLSEAFQREKIEGAAEVKRRRLIQWSILQHYEICATPLLDFTQSLRVACSFALLDAETEDPFVFAFGLPYLTNRVSVNSEHDLLNIRLLSICPPDALRPHYQEGYLAGTDEVTDDYVSKSELDFNNRLVGKFRIARRKSFWSGGFDPIPRRALYPDNDRIERLCKDLAAEESGGILASELGQFLQAWVAVESRLLTLARARKDRVFSPLDAIHVLQRSEALPADLAHRLNILRKVRNNAVHAPELLKPGQLSQALNEVAAVGEQLSKVAIQAPHSAP